MALDDVQSRRRGRPPASEEKRRRHNLTFRIRTDLREQLIARAQENGRSLSEEIEHLLEISINPRTTEEIFTKIRDHFGETIEHRALKLAADTIKNSSDRISRLEEKIANLSKG